MNIRTLVGTVALNILAISSFGQTEGVVEEFDVNFWKDSTGLTVLTPAEKEFKGVFLKDFHIKTFF